MIQNIWRTVRATVKKLGELSKALNVQRTIAVAFVGLFLLTTSVDNADLPASTKTMLNDMIARGAEGRPVTSNQWKAENKALQGDPAERIERIAKESADAIGEMGEMYPDTAESTLPGIENESLESDD